LIVDKCSSGQKLEVSQRLYGRCAFGDVSIFGLGNFWTGESRMEAATEKSVRENETQ
jgi:hypothetical protein